MIPDMNLKERLNSWDIRVALFDFDDTLVKTAEIFGVQMRAYVAQVLQRLGTYEFDAVFAILEEVNNAAYKRYAVNPRRWGTVAEEMESRFPEAGGSFVGCLPILMQIYTVVPELQQGAIETLEQFRASGVGLGMVTHAGQEWTNFKLAATGVGKYFGTQVWAVDQDRHKGPEDWLKGVEMFGVDPGQVLVVGDSLPGDIRASAGIGIKKRVWVPGSWVMYNSGEVPEGTIRVDEGIGRVVEALTAT